MRRLLCGAILLLLLAASSAPALAQVHGGDFWAGLGAGIGLPQGDAKEVYGQGYSASAFVLVTVLSRPSGGLSLRAEGHGLLSKAKEFDGISGDARVLAIGGAVEVHLETGSVRPYLVGGGGSYTFRLRTRYGSYEETEEERCFGWNAGAGIAVDVRSLTFFLEARYHRASFSRAPFVFVPVNLGIAF